MEVVISAIFLVYFSKDALDYFYFYQRLIRFIILEKDTVIPNLSFNLRIIERGLRLVKLMVALKVLLFLLFVFLFIHFSFQPTVMNQFIYISLPYFLLVFIVCLLMVVIHEQFFNKKLIYKGHRVKLSGWKKLIIVSRKEELLFYLYADELAISGKFELASNKEKNEYWKNLSEDD